MGMETTGTCPRCGGNMNPAQEGGLNFLKCEYCGYKAQVQTPAQEVIDIQGIPGMPSLHITRQASGVEAQWMNMVSQMSQQGFAMPQYDLNLTPERKQAIVEQVRASMGDAMADQVARSMGMAAGGMGTAQPAVAAPVATVQQMPGAQTWQGWPQTPPVQTNRLLRPLLIGAVITVGSCLAVALIGIAAMSLQSRGGSLNLTSLTAPLNRLLAGFGMPPPTGFSLMFGGGFLLG